MSVPPATGGEEGDWDFWDMSAGPSNGRKKRRIALDNIRGLVRRAGFSVPDNGLAAMVRAKCSVRVSTKQIELQGMMQSEWGRSRF